MAAEPETAAMEDESDDNEDVLPPAEFRCRARGSVSAEAYGDFNPRVAYNPPFIPKTDAQTARLKACLSDSFLFESLETDDMAIVIGAMSEVQVEPTHRLILQGDNGDCLYVVEHGKFDCVVETDEGNEKVVKSCEDGDVFGELALLYNCPRAASVHAVEESVCWKLDRDTFNHVVKARAQQKRARNEAFLTKVPVLERIDAHVRSQIADALCAETFADGQVVVGQGDMGKRFYIVEDGEAVATKDGEEVLRYTIGDYFGELALLHDKPRATTVTSIGTLKTLSLGRRAFNSLLSTSHIQDLASKYE